VSDMMERVNTPISVTELERRWTAVRAAMSDRKIDVLLMQNSNDFLGGYVKYFTDVPAVHGYPVTVVFPKDDLMTIVTPGKFGYERTLPPGGDGFFRGAKKILAAPYFPSAHYTASYDAELVEKGLEGRSGTIGIVGPSSFPSSMLDHLRNGRYSEAKFVDASDLVDQIKSIKSEEEISFIRRTAALQDRAIEAVFKALKPGMRELEMAAIAQHAILDGGGEQALLLTCGHTPGEPIYWGLRHFQNRALREGDMFSILVESNGPGGFYTEISRTAVLGKATQVMKDEFDMLLEARKFTLDQLRPGTACPKIWNTYNEYLQKNRKPKEGRLYCHGQGYDLVERPLVREDEPMLIHESMNITCHPTWISNGIFNTICDNFIVGKNGVSERLHKTPETLIELG